MESRKIKILAVFILSTAVIYFALANFYKTYQSEMDVLIVPQNEKTAVMHQYVLENAARLPLTVSFFDKLTRDTINIENPVEGLTPTEKKAYWNSKLETKILKDSGIVKFRAFDKDLDQAENIATVSATSDVFALSAYYNIKEDVQMRIIDGPITKNVGAFISLKVIVLSLTFGAILSIIMFLAIPFIQSRISPPDEAFYTKALPKDTFASKKETLESNLEYMEEVYAVPAKKEEIIKSEPLPEETPETLSYEKKATAPENLPIADASIMSMFGATKNGMGYKLPEKVSETGQKEEKPAVYREATTEEVKERLNRLLGGR